MTPCARRSATSAASSRRLASEQLEAAPADLEFADGRIGVRGAPSASVSYGDVIRRARARQPRRRGSLPEARRARSRDRPGRRFRPLDAGCRRRGGRGRPGDRQGRRAALSRRDVCRPGRRSGGRPAAGRRLCHVRHRPGPVRAAPVRWRPAVQRLARGLPDRRDPRHAGRDVVLDPRDRGTGGDPRARRGCLPPVMPAIANAVARATGVRLHEPAGHARGDPPRAARATAQAAQA